MKFTTKTKMIFAMSFTILLPFIFHFQISNCMSIAKNLNSNSQSEDSAVLNRIKLRENEITEYIKKNSREEEISDAPSNGLAFEKDGKESKIAQNTSGNLELFSSKTSITGDFEIKLKIKKMKEQGYLLIGFNRDEKAKETKKYFALNNNNGWGIGSNGYIIEYGKYAILPTLYLLEGDEVKLIRKNYVLGFSINGVFNSYGYLMEGGLFLTVNLKNKDDEIEIIS